MLQLAAAVSGCSWLPPLAAACGHECSRLVHSSACVCKHLLLARLVALAHDLERVIQGQHQGQ